jgi:YVTN family beta-propeller protein
LGDTLGIVDDLRDARKITRIPLQRDNSTQMVYPYDVETLPTRDNKSVAKVYISLWGDGSIAIVDPTKPAKPIRHILVDSHPTAMIFNRDKSKLFVVNSNADTVSIIDTNSDEEIERINVRLTEDALIGASPEGLALSQDEKTLYVANAHANAIAVVNLSGLDNPNEFKGNFENKKLNRVDTKGSKNTKNSQLLGFIPTGNYASAVAVVGNQLFVANGKGTGVENSSNVVNNSGRSPNMPNKDFTADQSGRGQYNPSLISSNFSLINLPTERELYAFTQSVMRNNNLLGPNKDKQIFPNGQSPFKHVIYIIRENRTYDQIFGDLATAGDGSKADGDSSVAIFGASEMAQSPTGQAQNITPNARALALRFGLLDRFFVNAEASPDGHNWSTAAFSNDFIDKSFRWSYSGRGRTYDFEGFNRLPSYYPPANQPPVSLPSVFNLPASENDLSNYLKKYVPYLNGNRDIGEPQSLYLWDAAKRDGLTYRNYGEFVATISEEDVKEVNTRVAKKYPNTSPTLSAFATKKTLENNFSPTFRNFDQNTPDSMTTESYRTAKETGDKNLAVISNENPNANFRGNSRFGEWRKEFRQYVSNLQAGKGDLMPNLSIVRFSNDHTSGLRADVPTPQFYVAENDYAVGLLVQEVSNSPYWRNTVIFVVEDDAQDGPDHVDAHRSPGFVVSAYNRKGALVHNFHNTVSLIRTLELCLGIKPMNFLDAYATPIDIFNNEPDFTPFTAILPDVSLDNLFPPNKITPEMQHYIELTNKQNLVHADLANARELNEIIWFSVRGNSSVMPEIASLPAFDLLRAGIIKEEKEEEEGRLPQNIIAKTNRKNKK